MPEVTLYGLSTCIHCKKARDFLEECLAEIQCTYVDKLEGEERKKCIAEVKQHNPGLSFPTIIIGDKVIIGFKEEEIREALGL